jgi:ABC-type glycerol-3-phosphate transport system permease component
VSLYANPWLRDFGLLMAGSFLATMPMAIVFLLMQQEYVTSTVYGALQ